MKMLKPFRWTRHAIERCLERKINPTEVMRALSQFCETVEDYPNDPRGHSRLVLTFLEGEPLHAVLGIADPEAVIVITVYRPDPLEWLEDFKTRRKR